MSDLEIPVKLSARTACMRRHQNWHPRHTSCTQLSTVTPRPKAESHKPPRVTAKRLSERSAKRRVPTRGSHKPKMLPCRNYGEESCRFNSSPVPGVSSQGSWCRKLRCQIEANIHTVKEGAREMQYFGPQPASSFGSCRILGVQVAGRRFEGFQD